jgi:hypothetical protein
MILVPAGNPAQHRSTSRNVTGCGCSCDCLSDPVTITPLPAPPELAASIPASRVITLVDADAVSHGLADGTRADRAPDAAVAACMALINATARALGSVGHTTAYRLRCASSTQTALRHLGVVAASGNNTWSIHRGLDGADAALLDELHALTASRATTLSRSRRRAIERPLEVVLLVAQDHAYAPAVRQLRLLGVPAWVLNPGRYIAAELYRAATAVTPLRRPMAA